MTSLAGARGSAVRCGRDGASTPTSVYACRQLTLSSRQMRELEADEDIVGNLNSGAGSPDGTAASLWSASGVRAWVLAVLGNLVRDPVVGCRRMVRQAASGVSLL